jgi:phosphate acetyltransferase
MIETFLENRTYDQIKFGDTASLERTVTENDIELFALVSGDVNPAHLDAEFAAKDIFGKPVAHGMWTASLVSAVLGTTLPGPGCIYLGQTIAFTKPVFPGDTVTATVTVLEKQDKKRLVRLETVCTNQDGETVLIGEATVIAPKDSVRVKRKHMPGIRLRRHDRYDAFIERAKASPTVRAAIVHPCSPIAIQGAVEVRDEDLLEPVLIGPRHKIEAAAEEAGVSIEGFDIIETEHSHAAAAKAVEMAVRGDVSVLVKGSLHTDELLGAVVTPDSGLRTERRISHVYAMDIPAYEKPLIVTDAAVNILPSLDQKRDICQNAVDLMHQLGVEEPLVAVLAAVETVNADMPATLDAAALTVMAARGQISGARVDGPLAFDNAISMAAAKTKGIVSPVAGQADILLVPDLEAGNILAKQLIYFADAIAAGLILGVRVPIVLTSRADPLTARMASAALARLSVGMTYTKSGS